MKYSIYLGALSVPSMLEIWEQHEEALELEEVLSFYMPNPLSGLFIDYCILVSIFSCVHHASSCIGRKIVSKS